MVIIRRLRSALRRAIRNALAAMPRPLRFAIIRRMIDCDPQPDRRLSFKIAETQEELEQCFRILHDAYVASGYMLPAPSGLRVTRYHALPTTTTLCAKFDDQVVGTITIIREGAFGFPLQSAFDLTGVRAKGGNIAEISALAIDPRFRQSGGALLFPLMKFMYLYCRDFFDTRHLVIAVNPKMIELYEAVLFFERLQDTPVKEYAFANGAPAVGATLDLARAQDLFEAEYAGRSARRDLHRYFVNTPIAGIHMPRRVVHLTNDPVLTPALLDHFFNRRTEVFATLDARDRLVLRSVYVEPEFRRVLPSVDAADLPSLRLRRHQRFTIRCPATWRPGGAADSSGVSLIIVDVSREGCRAEADGPLPVDVAGRLVLEWGRSIESNVGATLKRRQVAGGKHYLGFDVPRPDPTWEACVRALQSGVTAADLSRLGESARQHAA